MQENTFGIHTSEAIWPPALYPGSSATTRFTLPQEPPESTFSAKQNSTRPNVVKTALH